MKGKPEVHEVLAKMLKEELGAISEYFIHAEKLIERILFLNGTPNLNDMPKLAVGKDVKQQFENDLALEKNAVAEYNAGIAVCRKAGDQASADLLQKILADEEGHVDFLEEQLGLIEQIGIQNYLAQQV